MLPITKRKEFFFPFKISIRYKDLEPINIIDYLLQIADNSNINQFSNITFCTL